MASTEKIAVVTGAGTGVGKAVALALMKERYAVVLAGRRKELLEATANESKASGSRSLVVPTDVADPVSIRALFARLGCRRASTTRRTSSGSGASSRSALTVP